MITNLSKKYWAVLEQWAEKNCKEHFKKGHTKITLLICPYCGQVSGMVKAERSLDLKIEVKGEKNCEDCTVVSILEPTVFSWIGRVLGFQQIQKGE